MQVVGNPWITPMKAVGFTDLDKKKIAPKWGMDLSLLPNPQSVGSNEAPVTT